jgi:hypothetical protein
MGIRYSDCGCIHREQGGYQAFRPSGRDRRLRKQNFFLIMSKVRILLRLIMYLVIALIQEKVLFLLVGSNRIISPFPP